VRTPAPRVVVAGIGNVYRGDDGVGPAIAARLGPMLPSSVLVLEGLDDPLELIDAWDGAELAVVVDAVVSTARPGTVHQMEISGSLPAMLRRLSTHLFSVAQVIELGTVLERMPDRLVVVGVEAAEVGQGRVGLTPAVESAADQVVAEVRTLVAQHLGGARQGVLDA
jgi:hydrogenase maturation protease